MLGIEASVVEGMFPAVLFMFEHLQKDILMAPMRLQTTVETSSFL
jgi:hypothetical protein